MDLNIRNVPDDVVKAAKVKALSSDKTLRECVIELLQKFTADEKTPKRKNIKAS